MEARKGMEDIRQMLRGNLPAAKRKPLQPVQLRRGVFWKILPP